MSSTRAAAFYTAEQFITRYPTHRLVSKHILSARAGIVVYLEHDTIFTLSYEHTRADLWIIVAAGVRATVYDVRDPQADACKYQATVIWVHTGAELTYHLVDASEQHSVCHKELSVEVEAAGQATLYALFAGGVDTQYVCNFTGHGQGAQVVVRGAYLAYATQKFSYQAQQIHTVAGVSTDCLLKGVAADAANVVYNGRINIGIAASGSTAVQINKNMVIGDAAQVKTDPQLEVLNNQVSCKHAAAVGSVDADALAYLAARGLRVQVAQNLLLQGFLYDVFADAQASSMRAFLAKRLATFLR